MDGSETNPRFEFLQVSRLRPRCTWYPMPGPHQLWKSSPWQPWSHCSQEVPRAKGGHLADVLKGRVGGHKTASTKKRCKAYMMYYIFIYIYIFIYSYIYLYIYIYAGFATYQPTKEIELCLM